VIVLPVVEMQASSWTCATTSLLVGGFIPFSETKCPSAARSVTDGSGVHLGTDLPSVSMLSCFQPAQPCPFHNSSSASAGELMNLCDNPHSGSVGQEWAAVRPRGRVPIFVTANDLSLLYAVRELCCG